MNRSEKKRKKGKITPLGLSIKTGYVIPLSRRWMIILGFIGSAAVLVYFYFDSEFQKNAFISAGALSSNHADVEDDCMSCHAPGDGVTIDNCSSCHEKTSDSKLGVYSFKAHYLYRSADPVRISKDTLDKYHDRELICGTCHIEHGGRSAAITQVTDEKCIQCHEYDSFNRNHPEFEFIRSSTPDDSNLVVTHIRHTTFVLQKLNQINNLDSLFGVLKKSTGSSEHFFEEGCLYCHNPEPGGKNFMNLNFDRHCGGAGCHLNDKAVEGLPEFNPIKPKVPGVESLKTIKRRGGPGVAWAYVTNPSLIMSEDGEVSKSPIFHKDPWILENLKQIRKRIYGGEGLYNLLDARNADQNISRTRNDSLYSKAIRKLQVYADELRFRSELNDDLTKITGLLKLARKKMQRPALNRSFDAFALPDASIYLTQKERERFFELADILTEAGGPECGKCHLVENATILSAQADQDILIRAEFDHRAHVLDRRCTECHEEIEVNEQTLKISVANREEFKLKYPNVFAMDRSATQNIPDLESCQECHTPEKVSNNCVACHRFHPNKENRSSLSLFLKK